MTFMEGTLTRDSISYLRKNSPQIADTDQDHDQKVVEDLDTEEQQTIIPFHKKRTLSPHWKEDEEGLTGLEPLYQASISEEATRPVKADSLRFGGITTGILGTLGLLLLGIANPIGMVLLILSGATFSISLYVFWFETGIEVISPRNLVVITLGLVGAALASIFTLILGG
jgi:hypothetical protein